MCHDNGRTSPVSPGEQLWLLSQSPKAKTDCVSQDYLAENKELSMMDQKEVPLAE